MSSILILPDLHGRAFWREPVQQALDDPSQPPIVFLGDYLDPYSWEGITPGDAFAVFMEVLELKKRHPDRIHLLLGNHDLSYLHDAIGHCRHDDHRHALIHRLLTLNLPLFDLAWEVTVSGVPHLFTHAGVSCTWLKAHPELFLGRDTVTAAQLNDLLHADHDGHRLLLDALSDVSPLRGGHQHQGSMVWADVSEFLIRGDGLSGITQVFGHSQQIDAPLRIGRQGAADLYCLDCREAFLLDDAATLRHYSDHSPIDYPDAQRLRECLM